MTHIEWVLARSSFLDLLRRVSVDPVRTGSPPFARAGVGMSVTDDRVELIGRASSGDSWLGLIRGSADNAARMMLAPPAGCIGVIAIGRGETHGMAGGFCNVGHGLQPIDALRPVGAGMHRIVLAGINTGAAPALDEDPSRLEKWSRTIGALGLDGWRRLTRLHAAVIGAGPTAAAMKGALLRIGAQAMTCVTDAVSDGWPDAMDSILLDAAKPCELIVLAAEDPPTRTAASTIAVLYGKPVLDVVAFSGRAAARVSLVLPGQEHCMACLDLLAVGENRELSRAEDSAVQEFAIGVALRMLEDLVIERIGSSLIAEIRFDERGRLSVQYPAIARRGGCAVCALAGMGDTGVDHSSLP